MTSATWNGAVIAEGDDVEVVDGYTYFLADDVDHSFLQPSDHRSVCAWKGTASYFDLVVGDAVNKEAAWYYPDPSQRAAPSVGGRIGFWRGVKIERGDEDGGERRGLLGRLAGRGR